jgi:hypothetical protein
VRAESEVAQTPANFVLNLALYGRKIPLSDANLALVAENNRGAVELDLSNSPHISEAALAALCATCARLAALRLRECVQLRPSTLEMLGCPRRSCRCWT